MITGGCLCGAVRYEISARPMGGGLREYWTSADNGVVVGRSFCEVCGASVAAVNPQHPDMIPISPHGHTDPDGFATNHAFSNATELLLAPDHDLYRMLYSQGAPLEALGIAASDYVHGTLVAVDGGWLARRGDCAISPVACAT